MSKRSKQKNKFPIRAVFGQSTRRACVFICVSNNVTLFFVARALGKTNAVSESLLSVSTKTMATKMFREPIES